MKRELSSDKHGRVKQSQLRLRRGHHWRCERLKKSRICSNTTASRPIIFEHPVQRLAASMFTMLPLTGHRSARFLHLRQTDAHRCSTYERAAFHATCTVYFVFFTDYGLLPVTDGLQSTKTHEQKKKSRFCRLRMRSVLKFLTHQLATASVSHHAWQ